MGPVILLLVVYWLDDGGILFWVLLASVAIGAVNDAAGDPVGKWVTSANR